MKNILDYHDIPRLDLYFSSGGLWRNFWLLTKNETSFFSVFLLILGFEGPPGEIDHKVP